MLDKNSAKRAFEELHSESQNLPNCDGVIINEYSRKNYLSQRATEVDPTCDYHPEGMGRVLTFPAQLVAITDLALTLCKKRTPVHRVYRETRSSRSEPGQLLSEWTELNWKFKVLRYFIQTGGKKMQVLQIKSCQVLHPASQELIRIAGLVFNERLINKNVSYDEYHELDEGQIQNNLIGDKIREWFCVPANKKKVLDWESKYKDKRSQFLEEWGAVVQNSRSYLLRFDLSLSRGEKDIEGFEDPSTSFMNILECKERFHELAKENNILTNCKIMLSPYADFSKRWQIPVVLLCPSLDITQEIVMKEFNEVWRRSIGLFGYQINHQFKGSREYKEMDGEYRFADPVQKMHETAEQHLYRAAVYIFDAHWVADTKIENLCDVEGFLKKPRMNVPIATVDSADPTGECQSTNDQNTRLPDTALKSEIQDDEDWRCGIFLGY